MSKPKRSAQHPVKAKPSARHSAQVIDLDQVREAHQRALTERRVRKVLEENRFALKGLFATGLIFTQKGSRAGRDLLAAQLALLKLVDLLARTFEAGPSFSPAEEATIFAQLEAQLSRTAHLAARTGEFIAGRSSE